MLAWEQSAAISLSPPCVLISHKSSPMSAVSNRQARQPRHHWPLLLHLKASLAAACPHDLLTFWRITRRVEGFPPSFSASHRLGWWLVAISLSLLGLIRGGQGLQMFQLAEIGQDLFHFHCSCTVFLPCLEMRSYKISFSSKDYLEWNLLPVGSFNLASLDWRHKSSVDKPSNMNILCCHLSHSEDCSTILLLPNRVNTGDTVSPFWIELRVGVKCKKKHFGRRQKLLFVHNNQPFLAMKTCFLLLFHASRG